MNRRRIGYKEKDSCEEYFANEKDFSNASENIWSKQKEVST